MKIATAISFLATFSLYPLGSALELGPETWKETQTANEAIEQQEKQKLAEKKEKEEAEWLAEIEQIDNQKIEAMDDEEKILYEAKLHEYSNTMNLAEARSKAIEDVEKSSATKKKELQEIYDKQEQYEKWMAQKADQEAVAEAEQQMYDDYKQEKLAPVLYEIEAIMDAFSNLGKAYTRQEVSVRLEHSRDLLNRLGTCENELRALSPPNQRALKTTNFVLEIVALEKKIMEKHIESDVLELDGKDIQSGIAMGLSMKYALELADLVERFSDL